MRQSFFASALCLSLVQTSVDARAHNKFSQLKIRNGQPVVEVARSGRVLDWANRLFRRPVQRRQDETCVQDSYYNFIQDLPNGQSFCQGYMNYPNQTVTADYTPTSTYTDVYTTEVVTETEVERSTPIDTVTVTEVPTMRAKREADPQITARAVRNEAQIAQVFNMFRRRNGDTSSTGTSNDTESMSSAFSSACACQTYGGSTVTETYTDDPTVVTLSAFEETTTTTTTTRAARASTATVTVVAPPPTYMASSDTSASATAAPASTVNVTVVVSTTSSTSTATPTSPPLICPDDDGDVVSQMVGAERFDYLLNCSTDLTSSNFYGALYYSTLGQCVSACSYADANFSSPVCQGISYYNSPNVDGYNCFLKTSGNGSVPMPGVDSATLLRIVMGVDSKDPGGTTTEAVPFGGMTPTQNPSQMSSSMSEVMGNSTSTMPMITPGPPMPQSGYLVNAGGYTSYSTYVSNGSTLSTGTVFSTYYSSNGVWYESYYTSYSLQWTSATTEYAVGAQQTQIAGTNQTSTSQSSGAGGGYSVISDSNSTSYYPGGYNVTEVMTNQTYAENGTELSSSATTNYYSYQTGGGSGGSGGSGNGSVTSNAAGVTSTSLFSTQTIIINSGATGGASGYVASESIGAPSTSATTIYASGGTAYNSGYVVSGGLGSTGGASGYVASGSITSMPESTSVTVIIVKNGTAYSSGFVASGSIGGTGGASSYVASGSVMSLPANTSTAIIINTAGTAYSSGFVASGSIPLSTGPLSTPNAPRTGEYSTTSPVASSVTYPDTSDLRTGTYSGSVSTAPSGLPPGYPTFSISRPMSSESTPVTDNNNRTGSQSPPLSTGPAPYPTTSGLPRTGEYSTTTAITSSSIVPFPPSYPPFVPITPPVSTPNAPRTEEYSTSSPTAPASSGAPVPSGNETTSLIPTAPPSYPSLPASSGSPVPSPNSTIGSFSDTGLPRTGSQAPRSFFPTGTSPPIYTFPTSPPPYVPASCSNYTMGTTTMMVTTTVYGCFASCAPAGAYGYGAPPQSFGGGPGWSGEGQVPPAAESPSGT